jgi:acyl-CoA synthetase (AMP-forming)/AMP-acid ligase II
MSGNAAAPVGAVGEVWLRGANIMKEYWNDPGAVLCIIRYRNFVID